MIARLRLVTHLLKVRALHQPHCCHINRLMDCVCVCLRENDDERKGGGYCEESDADSASISFKSSVFLLTLHSF